MTSKMDRIKTLEARLAGLKLEARRAELAAQTRASKAARAIDTRRKILVGSFILNRMEGDISKLKIGNSTLLEWLTRPDDLALFLPSVAASPARAGDVAGAPTSPPPLLGEGE